ncbi:MAG TPA: DinB family protein [Candidatus Dormibacteraeota bacterium]|nr:DinB family protein [Candidatus Dormibacteraeota bacterium]
MTTTEPGSTDSRRASWWVPAELVHALRADLEELVELVGSLSADGLERRSDHGWSARQVLAHLADFELIAGVRVRMVLSFDRPPLASYAQDELTDRFADLETAAEALERVVVNRRALVRLLESLGERDWERLGTHPERGEETLRRTVEMIVRHDGLHLAQMRVAAGG